MAEQFFDVACTVCGCLCDDLTLWFDGERLLHVENDCPLARPWFDALKTAPARAVATTGETELSFEAALSEAADMLAASQAPLIYGLSRSSTPGQRAAVHLAERLGATIDTTASVCHGPSIMAIQSAGESTCSLGEIRQRADLVLFWGANPSLSHPRHFERYSVDPASEFLPGGRADRTVVVVDVKPTATAELADRVLQLERGRDFEAIWGLRQLVRHPDAEVTVDCGLSNVQLRWLAEQMRSCQYGVVFFGLGLAQSKLGHVAVDGLLRLVTELNNYTRFTARRMRIPGDVTGADSVLCWQTGFPFGVNLARPYPRYNPGEFTASELLERNDVDCCVVIGSESIDAFSPAARTRLSEIPTVLLESPHVERRFDPTLQFTTAVYGIHAEGTAYRMDEIPIPLRKLCDSRYPTDEEVLQGLIVRLPAG